MIEPRCSPRPRLTHRKTRANGTAAREARGSPLAAAFAEELDSGETITAIMTLVRQLREVADPWNMLEPSNAATCHSNFPGGSRQLKMSLAASNSYGGSVSQACNNSWRANESALSHRGNVITLRCRYRLHFQRTTSLAVRKACRGY